MTFVPANMRLDSDDNLTEIKKSSSLSGIKDKLEEQKEGKRKEQVEENDDEN